MAKGNRTRQRVARTVADADATITSMTTRFTDAVNQSVMRAQTRSVAALQDALSFAGGKIERTAANRRILAGIRDRFVTELGAAGFDTAVNSFLYSWPRVLPLFQDTLNEIFSSFSGPKPQPMTMDFAAAAELSKTAVRTKAELSDAVADLAQTAQSKALFSRGITTMSDLTNTLVRHTGQSIPQAETLAATGLTKYYRQVGKLTYDAIEDGPLGPQRYIYMGPNDVMTRPFCKDLLRHNHPRTMEEIKNLDNGQLPNPFISGGGYNCRHQWVMDVSRKAAK
jgi:hypothetical protein